MSSARRLKLLLAVALALVVGLAFSEPREAGAIRAWPVVGSPIDLSAYDLFPHGCGGPPSFPGADFETDVAVHPRNPSIVFTKGRPPDYASGDLYLSRTSDGGRTWSPARLILSTLASPIPMYPWGNTLRGLPGGKLLDTVMLWQPAGVTTVPLPQRG